MSQKKLKVRCGNGRWVDGSLVCVHLLAGLNQWNRVRWDRDTHWCCDACLALGLENVPFEDLQMCCAHCVRNLRRQIGVPECL